MGLRPERQLSQVLEGFKCQGENLVLNLRGNGEPCRAGEEDDTRTASL